MQVNGSENTHLLGSDKRQTYQDFLPLKERLISHKHTCTLVHTHSHGYS